MSKREQKERRLARKHNIFRAPHNYANLDYMVTASIGAEVRPNTNYNVYAFTLNGFGALGTTLTVPQE